MINQNLINDKIKELLKELKPLTYSFIQENIEHDGREIKDCFIYFVNQELFDKFITLEKSIDSTKKKPLYNLLNIVNPDKPIYKYNENIKLLKKYQLISDPDKCLRRMQSDFYIYKNLEQSKLNKYIKEYVSDYEEENNLRKEFEYNFKNKEKELNRILQNHNEYEILITTFTKELKYAHLYANFYTGNEKKSTNGKDFYIRETVPNIVLYTPKEEKESDKYKDNIVAKKFIDSANHLVGAIYYKKKN
ncbi:MAG: hypothetical protein U9Q30_06800 [Campylobacterota bacterium]|nr:hypothetical protein [Campylobacterota bacterium]